MNLSDIKPPLRFLTGFEDIWTKLSAIPRTGWVQWGIPQPETVAEHILATRRLVVAWQAELELSDVQQGEVLAMIEVHDWPKVLVGDQVILGDEVNVSELRKNKKQAEISAMKSLCENIRGGFEVWSFYERLEAQADDLAKLAKELGLFQALYLARDYEQQHHKPGLLAEFVRYTEPYLHHPFIVEKLRELNKEM